MGLLNIFSGKMPEELEKKGDQFVENREYGLAIMEYEKALNKLEKKPSDNPGYSGKLEKKVVDAKTSLARLHLENGKALIAAEVFDEAEDLFKLALGLTEDSSLSSEAEAGLKEIRQKLKETGQAEMVVPIEPFEEDEEFIHTEDEHFGAIINSLTPEESRAYQSYGDNFKTGYVALHNGDFETAAVKLSLSLDENPDEKNLIPLELATAKINLGMHNEALSLLQRFVLQYPSSTRAYTLMCEILWERGAFDEAQNLLSSCVPEISDSVPVILLKGETCFYLKKFNEAVSIYLVAIEEKGWDEHIARFLAKAYEALGLKEEARSVYGQLMGKCQGCGKKSDPYIMQRYAENSFALGDYSQGILEIYLNLAKTDPQNQKQYFKNISVIYTHLGNAEEAKRFSDFAEE